MTKLKTALLAVVPVAALAALWLGHQADSAAAPGQSAATAQGSHGGSLVAPGRVEPVRDPVALAFETQGRIAAIEVDEGARVTAGQVIARLDDRMARARVAAATASVAAAEARHALARRGPRAEDIAAARADADAATAEADHRGVEQERSARLGDSGALARSAVDADTAAAHAARATADAASARYRAIAKGTRAEQVDEAAAEVAAAKADLAAAEVALDQTVLRAPHDGVILRRMAEVGALVTMMAPAPVVTLADLGQLEVRAEVDEAEIAAVALGAPAVATADAFGDRAFPVHVIRITHELGRKTVRDDDPRARVDTRVLEVIARFDGPTDLPLGLRMSVHLAR